MKKFLKKIGSVAAITACLGYGLPPTCCVWGMDPDTEPVKYSFESAPNKDDCHVRWLETIYAPAMYDAMRIQSGNVLCYLGGENLFVELHSGFYTSDNIINTWASALSKLIPDYVSGCLMLTAADVLLLSVEKAPTTRDRVEDKIFRLNWKQNNLAFRALKALNNIVKVADAETAEFLLTCLKEYLVRLTRGLRNAMGENTAEQQTNKNLLVLGLGNNGNASNSLALIDYLQKLLKSDQLFQDAAACTIVLLRCLTGESMLEVVRNDIVKLIESDGHGKITDDMKAEIKSALLWMNYAFHTEAQCMVLHDVKKFTPVASPLVSLYNPCNSCKLLPYITRSKDTCFFEFLCVDQDFAKTVNAAAQKIDSKVPLAITKKPNNVAADGVDSQAQVPPDKVSRFSGILRPWTDVQKTVIGIVADMKNWDNLSAGGKNTLNWCQENKINPMHLKGQDQSGISLKCNEANTDAFRVYGGVPRLSDYKTRCLDRVQSALHTEGSSTQIKEILLRGMVLRCLKGNVTEALKPIKALVDKTTAYNGFKAPKDDVVCRNTAYSCTEEILNMDDVTSAQLTNIVNEYLGELRKDDTIELQFWPIIDDKGIGLGDAIASAFSIDIKVYDTWQGREDNSRMVHNFSSPHLSSDQESPNEKILMFRDISGTYHQIK